MRVKASKLRRHKHEQPHTRPFVRELDRAIRKEAQRQPGTAHTPITQEFLPHMKEQIKRRFTKGK